MVTTISLSPNFRRLTVQAFDSIRLVLVVLTVVLRLCLMPVYLQSYLNIAYDRLEEQKKEAGRITNIELKRKIYSIFGYLCVVTLQYVAPIIMCLYFALMYKTLGDYKWTDLYGNVVPDDECAIDAFVEPIAVVTEQIVQQINPDQFSEFVVDDATAAIDAAAAADGMFNSAKLSLEALKAVCFLVPAVLLRKISNIYFFFADIHKRSVSWFVWFCHVVELLCLVCCLITGHGLSIVFY